MNTRQIECFLEVGRLLNFTKAAQNLYLPQPAVSRYISSLETELETELFIRENNRRIRLSEDGKTWFNMFRRFSQEYQETRESLKKENTPLRFGYNIGWNISGFFPEIVSRCRAISPDFEITFECMEFSELTDAIEKGTLDAILTIESYPVSMEGFESERITSIRRLAAYSKYLKGQENIHTLSDLYPFDFYIVDDPRIQNLIQGIENELRPYHFVPKVKTVANMETVFAHIENGLGVAMLDEWCTNINDPSICTLKTEASHAISLVWRQGHMPSSLVLLKQELLKYFTNGN